MNLPFVYTDAGRAKTRPREQFDCSVRTYAIIMDFSYSKAHRIFAQNGRKRRRITKAGVSAAVLKEYKTQRPKPSKTIRAFIKANPVGRYILVIHRHMFPVIDGVVYDDQPPKPRSILLKYWKIS